VNREIVRWADALLEADVSRFGQVEAVGVDETLLVEEGPVEKEAVVHLGGGRGRPSALGHCAWQVQLKAPPHGFRSQPPGWCEAMSVGGVGACQAPIRWPMTGCCPTPVRWPTRSMWSGWRTAVWTWCAAGSRTRPSVHRGRKRDPLYRIRRLLIMASERLDDRGEKRIQGLLRAGDP